VTATGWAALAAAVLLGGRSGDARSRAAALTSEGRLARPGTGDAPPPRILVRAGALALVLAAAVALVTALGGMAAGIAAAAVARAGWVGLRGALARRRAAAAITELEAAVGALVAELEAGGRPEAALTAAAAAGPAHAAVFHESATRAAAGLDAAEPLVAGRITRPLGLAWRLAAATGAPPAAALGRVADDLAAEATQRRAVTVALAGPRASAVVLSGLPVLGLVLGAGMGAHPAAFLLDGRAGSIVGCVGVLLDVAGLAWIQRILTRAARG
jgi:tight adherence protein B